MSIYISQSFQDRIEISLASISRGPNDKFAVVNMKYVPTTFKCELCGHKPCVYAYTVKNLETGIAMDVGSECVKHFKAECDISVAQGLKKRIKSVINKMRRYIKRAYGDDYKEIEREEKRDMIIKLFMAFQAKEALKSDKKRVILSRDEVKEILAS